VISGGSLSRKEKEERRKQLRSRRNRTLHRWDGTGRDVEKEFLGVPLGNIDPTNPPPYQTFLEALTDAIQQVRSKGIWTPNRPNTDMARILFQDVLEGLQRCPEFQSLRSHELAFYPTIGTVLDYYHGVDAVFLLKDTWFATVDISLRNKKSPKANVVIDPSGIQDDAYFRKITGKIVFMLRKTALKRKHNKPLLV